MIFPMKNKGRLEETKQAVMRILKGRMEPELNQPVKTSGGVMRSELVEVAGAMPTGEAIGTRRTSTRTQSRQQTQ